MAFADMAAPGSTGPFSEREADGSFQIVTASSHVYIDQIKKN